MVEVLLSCMHESDFSLIKQSNLLDVKVLMVNQCNIEKEKMMIADEKHRMFQTPTRGLAVSRNLAITYSEADVCVFADNDESFFDNFNMKIEQAYKEISDADLIIFRIANFHRRLGGETKRLKKMDLLHVCSLQITFRTSAIKGKVYFDTNLGAGTGNGALEENKFLLDCYKAGMKIYYVPVDIATLRDGESTWFHGFNEEFFFNRGKTTRYVFGAPFALLYGAYYLVRKIPEYREDISFWNASKSFIKGFRVKDINQKYI